MKDSRTFSSFAATETLFLPILHKIRVFYHVSTPLNCKTTDPWTLPSTPNIFEKFENFFKSHTLLIHPIILYLVIIYTISKFPSHFLSLKKVMHDEFNCKMSQKLCTRIQTSILSRMPNPEGEYRFPNPDDVIFRDSLYFCESRPQGFWKWWNLTRNSTNISILARILRIRVRIPESWRESPKLRIQTVEC